MVIIITNCRHCRRDTTFNCSSCYRYNSTNTDNYNTYSHASNQIYEAYEYYEKLKEKSENEIERYYKELEIMNWIQVLFIVILFNFTYIVYKHFYMIRAPSKIGG